MHEEQTCNLLQKVSEQKQGIVLKWQGYSNGTVDYAMIGYTFIPKRHVVSTLGAGVMCTFAGAGFWIAMSKYVYIHDTKVNGSEGNVEKGTGSGVTYNNGAWVLTEIIGV